MSAIEMMVALAVVAITASLALPRSMGRRNGALTFTRYVANELQQVRFRAISSHRKHVVLVGERDVQVRADSRTGSLLLTLQAPSGVRLFGLESRQVTDATVAPSSPLPSGGVEIPLYPDGTVGDDGTGYTLFVGDEDFVRRGWRVVVSGVTGHVRIGEGFVR